MNMKRLFYLRKILILFMLSVTFLSCNSIPEPVSDSQYVNVGNSLPSSEPDKWLMAFLDVETTGLVPGYHEMIDIGLVYTDLDGNIVDSLFYRIQPQHPERLQPGAYAVNAFDPIKWKQLGALAPAVAVDSIISFHRRVAKSKHVLLVAYNSQFDTAYLDHLFRPCDRSWRELYHYLVLDIPSMAWGLGFRDLRMAELMETYNVKDEPHVAVDHTGITGAMVNIRLYRAIIHHQFEK